MVRNFRGQVKISDVQEEFDNLVNSINASIDEYNANLEKTENLDYSKGSATLGGSGYCLTIGGLKTLLNNYAGTMLGAKPFKTKDGAKTLVTAGIYIDSDGCSVTKGQLISKTGNHLYYDKTTGNYSISNDTVVPSGDWGSATLPTNSANTGNMYNVSVIDYNTNLYDNKNAAYMFLKSNSSTGWTTTLKKFSNNIPAIEPQVKCSFIDNLRINIVNNDTRGVWSFEIKVKTTDIEALNSLTEIISPRFNVYSSLLDRDQIVNADLSTSINFSDILTNTGKTITTAVQDVVINIKDEEGYKIISFNISNSMSSFHDPYFTTGVKISIGLGASNKTQSDTLPRNMPITIRNCDISNVEMFGVTSPSGVCDMNPNRTYPYIKTFHNAELVNLRTNKITTESRNLTNGNTSGGDITYDTYSPTDNKDAGIFVSYNARKSNASRPTGALFTIAGVVSNVELGTRFTHGSSTSACYRYPKFFFLPKGVTTPFSTTAADNIVRYNKYVATISQKV